jgi:hypothetical protein
MKLLFYSILLISTLVGCHKNEVIPASDISSKYVQLGLGFTWTYQVDSIHYYGNISQKPDTFLRYVKNSIVDTFTLGGAKNYLFEQTRSTSLDGPWVFSENFNQTRLNNELRHTTNNKSWVPFITPIALDATWNYNKYNSDALLECYFEKVHAPTQIFTQNYDSTSTVYCEILLNRYQFNFKRETFASNYGLIQKEVKDIDSSNLSTGLKGYKYTWKLKSFEK